MPIQNVRMGNVKLPILREAPQLLVEDPQLPPEPSLRAIADDVLARCRYSFVTAAVGAGGPSHPGLDETCGSFIASRSEAALARYQSGAKALVQAPIEFRSSFFGRYAAISVEDFRSLGADGAVQKLGHLQIEPATMRSHLDAFHARVLRVATAAPLGDGGDQAFFHLDPKAIQAAIGAAGKPEPNLGGLGPLIKDMQAGSAFKKMRLFIRKVRCIEETSGLAEGSDEINMGGTAVDPLGNTSMVNQFQVSDDFDEGEVVDWGMGKVFTTWNLATAPEGFPYLYSAIIALAEKDDGGFYKFLHDLWDGVSKEVTAAIGAAVGAAIGGAIANALGAVVGAIVGALIGWIISLFNNPDDIVGVKTVYMTLAASTKSYYDWAQLTAPLGWQHAFDFTRDGHYRVATSHKIFAA
jgi:hypothetical protein